MTRRFWTVKQIRASDLAEGDVCRVNGGVWWPYSEGTLPPTVSEVDLVDVQVPEMTVEETVAFMDRISDPDVPLP